MSSNTNDNFIICCVLFIIARLFLFRGEPDNWDKFDSTIDDVYILQGGEVNEV